jgi:hypothetical protein
MSGNIEQMARDIATMDRPQLMGLLREMACPFKMDFSDEYLDSVTLERLRHIALAAALHCQKTASPAPVPVRR